jgi:hypothetical protein
MRSALEGWEEAPSPPLLFGAFRRGRPLLTQKGNIRTLPTMKQGRVPLTF